MKKLFLTMLVFVLIFLTACTNQNCGDGVCDKITEGKLLCPQDCDPNYSVCGDGKVTGLENCENCAKDFNCGDGFECVDNNCKKIIVKPDCFINSDCNQGFECVDGNCVVKDTSSVDENVCELLNCDDYNPCTIDSCNETIGCVNSFVKDKTSCGYNQECHQGRCVQIISCSSNDDCDDGIECTIDKCNDFNHCVHTSNNSLCSDGVDCTVDECTQSGCIHTPTDIFCNDGVDCTEDICTLTGCEFYPNDFLCDDGVNSTMDYCTSKGCVHEEVDYEVCETDADCTSGVCFFGICVDCVSNDDCDNDFVCINYECVDQSSVDCVSDDDCGEGLVCINNECVNGSECVSNDDCVVGVCSDGVCVDCVSDDDCGEGLVCIDNECVVEAQRIFCDSFDSCNKALRKAKEGDIVTLTENVSKISILTFDNKNNVTFDCDNHIIEQGSFSINNSPNSVIKNCVLKNSVTSSILLSSSSDSELISIQVNGSGGDAGIIITDSPRVRILDSTILDSKNGGIFFQPGSSSGEVIDCRINNNAGTGVIAYADRIIVNNSEINENKNGGFYGKSKNGIQITNSDILNNLSGEAGVFLGNANNCLIENNSICGNEVEPGSKISIHLNSGSNNTGSKNHCDETINWRDEGEEKGCNYSCD